MFFKVNKVYVVLKCSIHPIKLRYLKFKKKVNFNIHKVSLVVFYNYSVAKEVTYLESI